MYRTELKSPFFIYTNDIKRNLAENKSWLKVICTCRNINTVNSVYTNLHVSLLNNIRWKQKYSHISKIYPPLHFQKYFKTFLGCFILWYEMCTITLKLDDRNFVNFAKWTRKLCFDSFSVEWTLTQRVISGFFLIGSFNFDNLTD